jgi:hypothetical protein
MLPRRDGTVQVAGFLAAIEKVAAFLGPLLERGPSHSERWVPIELLQQQAIQTGDGHQRSQIMAGPEKGDAT